MRQIAKQLGVTDMTVRRDLAEAEARATFAAPDQITGADGKSYPARRPAQSPLPAPGVGLGAGRAVLAAKIERPLWVSKAVSGSL